MNSRLNLEDLDLHKMKRFKALVGVLAKSHLVQSAAVRVVHNYSHPEQGQDYVFEAIAGDDRGYLRGSGENVRCGDHLILNNGSETTRYQVDEIAPAIDHPDFWIALLHPCASASGDRPLWMKSAESCCELSLN